MKFVVLIVALVLYMGVALIPCYAESIFLNEFRKFKSSLFESGFTSAKEKSKSVKDVAVTKLNHYGLDSQNRVIFLMEDNCEELETTSGTRTLFQGSAQPPAGSPTHAPKRSTLPTAQPTMLPSDAPTTSPSQAPSQPPTESPTSLPPTLSPTEAPSEVPTMSPTSAEYYIMSVTQDLNGITATQFENSSANSEAFVGAVADTLHGINASNVIVQSVTDAVATAAVGFHLRRLQTDSVNIDYTIQYNIATLNFSGDPDGAYDHLITTLSNAVSDHTFDVNLARNGVDYDATDLISVTSGNVSSSGFTSLSGDDDVIDDDMQLSERDKIIIGVVVCVVLLLIGCIIAGVMIVCERRSRQETSNVEHSFVAVNSEHTSAVELVPTKSDSSSTGHGLNKEGALV